MKLPEIKYQFHTTQEIDDKTYQFRALDAGESTRLKLAVSVDDVSETISAWRQIIESCVLDFDVSKATLYQMDALLMEVSSKSSERLSERLIEYTCGSCEKTNDFSSDLLDYPKDLEYKTIKFEGKGGLLIHCTDEILFDTYAKIIKEVDSESENGDLLSLALKNDKSNLSFISHIEDVENGEIYYRSDAVTDSDIEEFDKFAIKVFKYESDLDKLKKFTSDIKRAIISKDCKCKHCGFEEVVNVDGTLSFFV